MAFVLEDRVRETSTTTGLTNFALAATSDFRRFGDAGIMANGDTTFYCAVLGSAWETGIGTWVTGHTLQRTTILESSNAGAKVSFGAGVKDIFMTLPGSRVLVRNASGYVGIGREGRTYIDIDGAGVFPSLDGAAVYLADSVNVAHGMTAMHPTDVWGVLVKALTNGGMIVRGIEASGTAPALKIDGFLGSATPTAPATQIRGFKKSGTSIAALGAAEIVTEILNFSTVLFRMLGNGIATFFNTVELAASVAANASLRVPAGVAPTSPVAGDVWNDGRDLKARVNGKSKSLTLLPNYLTGLTLSAAGSTATFGIAAGAAADSTNSGLMELASAYTKTTGAWAVGSGNGALDAGTIAPNTFYKVFEIERPDTGVVDIAITTNAVAAGPTTGGNIPSAYTAFRYIGSMRTDGASQWKAFTQIGNRFTWTDFVLDSNIAATVASRVATTVTVPIGAPMIALFRVTLGGGGATSLFIASLTETDVAPTTVGATSIGTTSGALLAIAHFEVMTNALAQVGIRASGTSGTLTIGTYGWIDPLLK